MQADVQAELQHQPSQHGAGGKTLDYFVRSFIKSCYGQSGNKGGFAVTSGTLRRERARTLRKTPKNHLNYLLWISDQHRTHASSSSTDENDWTPIKMLRLRTRSQPKGSTSSNM